MNAVGKQGRWKATIGFSVVRNWEIILDKFWLQDFVNLGQSKSALKHPKIFKSKLKEMFAKKGFHQYGRDASFNKALDNQLLPLGCARWIHRCFPSHKKPTPCISSQYIRPKEDLILHGRLLAMGQNLCSSNLLRNPAMLMLFLLTKGGSVASLLAEWWDALEN